MGRWDAGLTGTRGTAVGALSLNSLVPVPSLSFCSKCMEDPIKPYYFFYLCERISGAERARIRSS